MALGSIIVGNATAQDTIYTMVPKSATLGSLLGNIGVTGPIIFSLAGEQRKFNISQKAKSATLKRTTDGNTIAYNTPSSNIVGIEFSFQPASPTIQILSNIAKSQNTVGGPFVFSLNATNPSGQTTTQYEIFILTTPFSGFEENERVEDVVFQFEGIPPSMVNVGALASLAGGILG